MTLEPAALVALVMLAALALYALLAGADFGAGVWDLLARGPRAERQRAVIERAIGPVWEVNHIWMILVIVLLFTGFPRAFAAIMTAMHVPLSLMLVGIVLRGSAFTFRGYDNIPPHRRRWNRLFSVPSAVVPILLGCVVGSLSTGRLGPEGTRVFEPWWGVFPLLVGLLALCTFAFLAAVYLTLEAPDSALREDFRVRALASAAVLGAFALATYALARSHAPLVYQKLHARDWGWTLRLATGGFAVLAFGLIWGRHYFLARLAAVAQVLLILGGCAAALAPALVPPDLTIANTAAPRVVHLWLLAALGAGALVLVPSLFLLFRLFKRNVLWPEAL